MYAHGKADLPLAPKTSPIDGREHLICCTGASLSLTLKTSDERPNKPEGLDCRETAMVSEGRVRFTDADVTS